MQHVAESHWPPAQTVLSEFLEYPDWQLKVAQVGGGVVVTVVRMTVQQTALSQ